MDGVSVDDVLSHIVKLRNLINPHCELNLDINEHYLYGLDLDHSFMSNSVNGIEIFTILKDVYEFTILVFVNETQHEFNYPFMLSAFHNNTYILLDTLFECINTREILLDLIKYSTKIEYVKIRKV